MDETNRKQPFAPRQLPPDRRAGGSFAKAIGAVVPKVTAAAFNRFGFHNAEIMTSWATIAGPELARLTQPEQIRWPRGTKNAPADDTGSGRTGGATLMLRCEPAFALEISYRTGEIIDRVNRYFGYRAIGQLRLVQAATPGQLNGQAAAPASAPSPAAAGTPGKSGNVSEALAVLSGNLARSRGPRR